MKITKAYIIRWIVFLIGLIVLSYGVVLTIVAELGVSPWDVLHLGIANATGMTPGTAVLVVSIFVIALVCILMKSLPQVGTILNMIVIGAFIDVFLLYDLIPDITQFYQKVFVLLIGIILFGGGAGLYLSSNMGAGPRDGLVLLIHLKKRWSVSRIKTATELLVLVIGAVLGGPVGFGTVVISLTIGPVMGASLDFWNDHLGKYMKDKENEYEVVN